MSERRELEVEPIEFLVSRVTTDDGRRTTDGGGESEQDARGPRRVRPHEVGRKRRQMSVTFPDAAWGAAVRDLADEWGVRPGDVVVYAVARLLAGVEGGEVGRPRVERVRPWHRAGECLELPWIPPESSSE